MKEFQTLFICNCIVRAVAFICITIAAISFCKVGVLWFYLVPLFMGIDYKKQNTAEREGEK